MFYFSVILHQYKYYIISLLTNQTKCAILSSVRDTAFQKTHISRKNFQKGVDKYDAS